MTEFLQARSLKPERKNSVGLSDCLQRADRGLVNYQSFNTTELWQFVGDRKLRLSGDVHKADLVELLQQSDDDLMFRKLIQ